MPYSKPLTLYASPLTAVNLTPAGIEEKAHVTSEFLKRKLVEYETIQQEIAELQADMAAK